jgi:type II secretory pathway component PulF
MSSTTHIDPLIFIVAVLASLILELAPVCGLLYTIYFVLTLPMRRRERGRLFLDLLEMGLGEGLTPEKAIESAASSYDPSLGERFHRLGPHLQNGLTLGQALDRVPYLLPPRLVAMLKTGERIGDIRKVLPACHNLLRDAVSQVRGALNYLVLMAFVITPMTIMVPIILRIKVMPSFEQIFAGMSENYQLPAFTRFMFASNWLTTLIQLLILLALWVALLFYAGGPRLRHGVSNLFGAHAWTSPWNCRRLQRDFSAMLAALLDSGVPEKEAVRLAGESTAEPVMRCRADQVCRQLEQGVPLPEALRTMDKKGELAWRIANALRHGKGFLQALTGWHESLDAKAFQLEQSAAQVTTSALVVVNGVIVACIVIGVFAALIRLINEGVLW